MLWLLWRLELWTSGCRKMKIVKLNYFLVWAWLIDDRSTLRNNVRNVNWILILSKKQFWLWMRQIIVKKVQSEDVRKWSNKAYKRCRCHNEMVRIGSIWIITWKQRKRAHVHDQANKLLPFPLWTKNNSFKNHIDKLLQVDPSRWDTVGFTKVAVACALYLNDLSHYTGITGVCL